MRSACASSEAAVSEADAAVILASSKNALVIGILLVGDRSSRTCWIVSAPRDGSVMKNAAGPRIGVPPGSSRHSGLNPPRIE